MGTYANITVKLADGSQEYLETGEGHPSILGKDLVSAGFWRRTPGGISAEEEGAVMDFFCEEMGASEGHLDNPDYEYFIDPGDLFRCYYRDTQEADDVRHPLISAFVDNDDVENDDIRDLFRQLFEDFVKRTGVSGKGETASASEAVPESEETGTTEEPEAPEEISPAEAISEEESPENGSPVAEPASGAPGDASETGTEIVSGNEAVRAEFSDPEVSGAVKEEFSDRGTEELPNEEPKEIPETEKVPSVSGTEQAGTVSEVGAVPESADSDIPSPKWVSRYFEIAGLVGTWSKDPSTKVGAIIVGDKGQIISQGYNGFPRGVKDSPERYNNRELKYRLVVHAEMNAILNALYNGSSVVGASIYIHNLPVCQECAKAIIQAGLARVFIDTSVNERWGEAWEISKTMFSESGVRCYYFDREALRLERII